MAFRINDRVKETSITVGIGNLTLAGAVSGFQAFSVFANNDTFFYAVVHQTLAEWEVGIGTYVSATPALARTTVLESSNADALVSFSAGTKDVFITIPGKVGLHAQTLAYEPTLINIVSSTVETDIFNQTIKANMLGTNRIAQLSLYADRLNNSGVTEAAGTLRIYLGGVVRYADAAIALATSTSRVPVSYDIRVMMQNATNLVYIGGVLRWGTAGGATTGIGNYSTDEVNVHTPFASGGTFTLDMTLDQVLRVTFQLGTNSALVDYRRQYAMLQLM